MISAIMLMSKLMSHNNVPGFDILRSVSPVVCIAPSHCFNSLWVLTHFANNWRVLFNLAKKDAITSGSIVNLSRNLLDVLSRCMVTPEEKRQRSTTIRLQRMHFTL